MSKSPAGSYTLEFKGLNPYGGDNTALLDNVTLNGTPVGGGFEAPALAAGSFAYQPAGGGWSFVGDSGVTTNSGVFAVNNLYRYCAGDPVNCVLRY